MDRWDAEEQMAQVRRLLLRWDALGVADEPQCQNEYDCMIGPLLHLLRDGADEATVHDWIARECVDHFGLDPDPTNDRALAQALIITRGSLLP